MPAGGIRKVAGMHEVNGRTLDPELRDRVLGGAQHFSEAFECALAQGTPDALGRLREATDELMRAAGRVLIEAARVSGE